jgi:choline-sulfatase
MPTVKQPNVIVCICDQLRAFETGCYGNEVIRTPHIDQLAANSVRFEVAVTSNPVCMAARSGVMSAQHSRSCTGHLENDCADTGGKGYGVLEPEFPERDRGAHLPGTTLPEALSAAGYQCAAIGKWHIRPAPEALGFEHSVLPLCNHRHSNQQFMIDGAAPVAIDGFNVEREIDKVEEFLAGAASANPFFLYYSIMPPHMPVGDMPEQYLDMYAPQDVPLRPNVERDGRLPVSEEWFKIYLWDYVYYHYREPHTLELPADFDIRKLTALYYGAVTWVDDMVGRMMRSLQANGLADDTIVIFTSDHGDNLGSHHLWNKGVLLEESIRVPMLYHCRGRWAAAVNRDQVASTIDIMPTILDACGLELPEGLQGQSLLPILSAERTALDRSWSFVETSRSSAGQGLTEIGIRTPSHLYGMCLDAQSHALVDADYCFYDLEQDPYEFDNMVGTGRAADLEGELKQRLLDWHEQTDWLTDPDCGPDRSHLFDENGMPRENQ